MSVTAGGDQGQGGNDNQDANPVTQQTQEDVAATGVAAIVGGGDPNAQAINPVTVGVGGLQNANPHQLLLWDGNWPGATGKLARDMTASAGTPASQKDIAEQAYTYLKDPTSHLGAIGTDTQPVAYLIHVAGTTTVRVLYGLSPVTDNPFMPEKPKFFRALMRDLDSETARYPGLIKLPANILEVNGVEVPKDDFFLAQLGDDTVDKHTPWLKTGASNGAMTQANKGIAGMMKLVPVPLYTVVDGLEQDLHAGEVFERIKFINALDNREFLSHAMNFCKGCVTQYGANAKKPTMAADVFAQLPDAGDRAWALGRTMQMCPNVTVQQAAPANAGAAAAAGVNTQMMQLMAQLLAQQGPNNGANQGGGSQAAAATAGEEELQEQSWEGKLNLAKSGVEHLLKFCGLDEGQESLIPKLWFRLGEKKMEKVDKQREIRRVLEDNKTYEEVNAPVTSSLIKIIGKKDWCEGESTVNLSNIMKGLSIFAMRPLTDVEISEYDAYDECLDKASNTTVQDVASGSGKRKHHVPSSCYGLETYVKSMINILDALTDGNSPHADDLKSIIAKLQRWDSCARGALTKKQIGTYLWVILKESRRFFNASSSDKSPAFRAMLASMDSQTPYETVGLPAGLVETKEPNPKGPGKQKGKRIRETPDIVPTTPGAAIIEDLFESPSKQPKIRMDKHPLIIEKLGTTLTKAKRHRVGMVQLCELVGMKIWDMFPVHCGHTTLYGKCGKAGCEFNHDPLPTDVAKKIVTNFKKIIDDPTLITG